MRSNLKFNRKKMAFIHTIKAQKGCKICGESDPIVLEFHHLNPKEKRKELNGRGRGFNRLSYMHILEEVEKCEVLCANCHRRKTHYEHYLKNRKEIT